ncbi:MAG: NADH-quinone oxidoreductase subunit A [Halomonas sp.]|uniref:NADH-quinone oxidoreductase subunit n=1 Tax=Halomonas sulfidivorans TaxID=2733488 RepID=A0ABX7WDP7_9GAMM|nr:NADH-quinone oxidoreductase subunit A [Halomonas sulfidivorans]MDX5376450.1 NADH-quinone oxidoreductase subunit A [Halomonas sp.]MDX5502149.1 NADH-quinone oxidoreductase subunit A [Halomonas sp.]QTP58050.1 NADH-quinone oxidoreductase subunit A [Halomonas sulfidivorans]
MALLTLTTVLMATLGLGWLLQWLPARGQPKPTYSQRAPFLGGGSPDTHAWSRYHIRYYPMTLLLIAFEMEMMFMYPWAVVFVEKGATAVMEMGMFLAILSVGIVYAWREGVFRWQ